MAKPTLSVEAISTGLDALQPTKSDVGLRKTLASPFTLKLPAGMPATSAAHLYALNKPTLAVVIEPGTQSPVAIFHPEEIVRRYGKPGRTGTPTLEDLLKDLGDPARKPGAPAFNVSIVMHYCEIGQHYVSQSRCPVHEE